MRLAVLLAQMELQLVCQGPKVRLRQHHAREQVGGDPLEQRHIEGQELGQFTSQIERNIKISSFSLGYLRFRLPAATSTEKTALIP